MRDGRAVKAYTDPKVPADHSHGPADFVEFIDNLYEVASGYRGEQDTNTLVLDFLRHEEYANYQWRRLVGDIDQDFLAHVKRSGLHLMRSFGDLTFGVAYKTSHFGAACIGVYQHGRAPEIGVNRGDITGWGGDWITFYGDWRRDKVDYLNGYDYCHDRLASARVDSTFMLSDLLEDVDAYDVGIMAHDGATIAEAVRSVFDQPAPRIARFIRDRFSDDDVIAQDVAKNVLVGRDDVLVSLGRIYLVEAIGGVPTPLPGMLPGERIDQFCRGFVSVVRRCAEDERRLLATPDTLDVLSSEGLR
jgi:hypothetical protein